MAEKTPPIQTPAEACVKCAVRKPERPPCSLPGHHPLQGSAVTAPSSPLLFPTASPLRLRAVTFTLGLRRPEPGLCGRLTPAPHLPPQPAGPAAAGQGQQLMSAAPNAASRPPPAAPGPARPPRRLCALMTSFVQSAPCLLSGLSVRLDYHRLRREEAGSLGDLQKGWSMGAGAPAPFHAIHIIRSGSKGISHHPDFPAVPTWFKVHVCVRVHAHTCTHVRTHVHTCTQVYSHTCTHTPHIHL